MIPAVSSFSIPTALLNGRYKTKDDPEEKEQVKEPTASVSDLNPLCKFIFHELKERNTPRNIVEKITMFSPEIFSILSAFEKQEIIGVVQKHIAASCYTPLEESNMMAAILILYSTSLINSSSGVVAKNLEKELYAFMNLTQQSYAQNLVTEANIYIPCAVAQTIEDIQERLGKIRLLSRKINQFINLYYYLDPTIRGKLQNIFTYSNQFPVCKKLFHHFCNNLSLCKHEHSELIRLNKRLTAQATFLQKELKELQEPMIQRLSIDREQMLERQAVLLWNAGSDFLEQGIKLHFSKANSDPSFLNTHDEFKVFSALALSQREIDKLLPRFVCKTWSHLLENESPIGDVADFMRLVIGKMPEPIFKKLEADLKTSQDKKGTVLAALNAFSQGMGL